MLLGVTCVGFQPLLVGNNDIYNQRVLKLVLVKEVGKGRTHLERIDFLIHLIRLVNLLKILMVVRAMDMVTPHSGNRERYLLLNIRKRILGPRLSRNFLQQKFSKGLRLALALIAVSKAIYIFEACTKPKP